MADLSEMNIKQFVEELASPSPAPGGGAVAALSGALGAGLVSMVANLTIGKKGYEEYSEEMERICSEAETLRNDFLNLFEEDTEAFNEVIEAFRLPKGTEDEKKIRKEAIQHSLQKATLVPFRTIENGYKLLKLTEIVARIGNKNSVSDAGVAAVMALSAVKGGALNVWINLVSIKDKQFVKDYSTKVEDILPKAEKLAESVLLDIKKNI